MLRLPSSFTSRRRGVEAIDQLNRALGQIATLFSTPALRQEQIKLQVALINPLMHVIGHATPETKAAGERARLLIEQAEGLGEPPEDPLLLFSVLCGVWVANYAAFNGDVLREVAAQSLTLAEKHPLMLGHRLIATSLMTTGSILEGRAHYDQALALYDPVEHRSLVTRFGQDTGVTILGFRSLCRWFLPRPRSKTLAASSVMLAKSATLLR